MRTKTNLKNPTCFDRFADHHQGLVLVPCTVTTCQFFCFFAFQFQDKDLLVSFSRRTLLHGVSK